jgi:hypothetical protein
MRFNNIQLACLFVRVRVKLLPRGEKCLRAVAGTFQGFTSANAQITKDFPLSTTREQLDRLVAQMQEETNAAQVRVDLQKSIEKRMIREAVAG